MIDHLRAAINFLEEASARLAEGRVTLVGIACYTAVERVVDWHRAVSGREGVLALVLDGRSGQERESEDLHRDRMEYARQMGFVQSRDENRSLREARPADLYDNVRRRSGLEEAPLTEEMARDAFAVACLAISRATSSHHPELQPAIEAIRAQARRHPFALLVEVRHLEERVLAGDFVPEVSRDLDRLLRRYASPETPRARGIARILTTMAVHRSMHQGEFGEEEAGVLGLLPRAIELSRGWRDPGRTHHLFRSAGVACRHLGRHDEAEAHLSTARAIAGSNKLLLHHVWSQEVLLHAARGDLVRAGKEARYLVADAEELGMAPLVQARQVTLANVLLKRGESDEALALLEPLAAQESLDVTRRLFVYRELVRAHAAKANRLDKMLTYASMVRQLAVPRQTWRHVDAVDAIVANALTRGIRERRAS